MPTPAPPAPQFRKHRARLFGFFLRRSVPFLGRAHRLSVVSLVPKPSKVATDMWRATCDEQRAITWQQGISWRSSTWGCPAMLVTMQLSGLPSDTAAPTI
jgi:hypothetical protein